MILRTTIRITIRGTISTIITINVTILTNIYIQIISSNAWKTYISFSCRMETCFTRLYAIFALIVICITILTNWTIRITCCWLQIKSWVAYWTCIYLNTCANLAISMTILTVSSRLIRICIIGAHCNTSNCSLKKVFTSNANTFILSI